MRELRLRWLWSAIALVGVAQPASAAMVQYVLDQSNAETVLPDGVPRVSVTINDPTNNNSGNIVFTVATLPGAFDEGSNFGIQSFGFNLAAGAPALSASKFILPSGWSVRSARNQDGFGRFDWVLTRSSSGSRLDPLTFQIKNVAGDTVLSYFDLSTGSSGQGNVAFAAHVAGFNSGTGDDEEDEITSAYIGGGTPVPVPAAAWLLGSGLLGLMGFARRRQVA